MRFLLINNNPAVSRLITLSVNKLGFQIDEISKVDDLPKENYDIVIIDNELYDSEMINGLKENGLSKHFVYVSSKGENKPENMDAVLEKPFLPTDFIDLVTKFDSKIDEEETKEEEEIAMDDLDNLDIPAVNDFDDDLNVAEDEKASIKLEDEQMDVDIAVPAIDDESFDEEKIEKQEEDELSNIENVSENIDENIDENIEDEKLDSILDSEDIDEVKHLLEEDEKVDEISEEDFELDEIDDENEIKEEEIKEKNDLLEALKEIEEKEEDVELEQEDSTDELLLDEELNIDELEEESNKNLDALNLDEIDEKEEDDEPLLDINENDLSLDELEEELKLEDPEDSKDEPVLDEKLSLDMNEEENSDLNELENEEVDEAEEPILDSFNESKFDKEIQEEENLGKISEVLNDISSLDDLNENDLLMALGDKNTSQVIAEIPKEENQEIEEELREVVSNGVREALQNSSIRDSLKGLKLNITINFEES